MDFQRVIRWLRPIPVVFVKIAAIVVPIALAACGLIWNSMFPMSKMLALLVCGMALRNLQRILGPARRRSSHWLIQYGAWGAFYVPFPLAAYALSIMTSYSEVIIKVVWGELLLDYVMRHTSSMTSYRLNDGLQYGTLHAKRLIYPAYWVAIVFNSDLEYFEGVLREMIYGVDAKELENWELFAVILFVLVRVLVLTAISLFGLVMMTRLNLQRPVLPEIKSCYYSQKMAEHMKLQLHNDNLLFNDGPTSLDNCRYPFQTDIDGDHMFVIQDVFQKLTIPEEERAHCHNVLLSYSFSNLIKRRHYGYRCAEEGNQEVRRFVLNEFLEDGTNASGLRAFEVVELQLSFLYDHFFTARSHLVYEMSLLFVRRVLSRGLWPAFIMLISTILFPGFVLELHLAFILALIDQISEMIWTLSYQASDWYEVWHAFQSCCDRNISDRSSRTDKFLGCFGRDSSRWKNQIGQYSLLEDYGRVSAQGTVKTLMAWLAGIAFDDHNDFVSHYPVEEDAVNLPSGVRERIFSALKIQSEGIAGTLTLTNGVTTLQRYRPSHKLLWTSSQPTHTDTILIWHIATWHCQMSPLERRNRNKTRHYEVATALSGYCAYLVAFLPEFLPEHSLTTTIVFQRVLSEAKQTLPNASSETEKRSKMDLMEGLELPQETDSLTTFEKGVALGRQLESLEESFRWKVMAEFWAETMLYIAPSDKVAAHIDRLAKGGEFITHVWAMLSNAGILKRGQND